MAGRPHPKRALYLEGLYFEPGRPFSSVPAAERLYGLLLGEDYYAGTRSVQEQRERATRILSAIFSTSLARVGTFVTLNDLKLGWQIVAGDIVENYGANITPAEVEELVRVFSEARARYFGHPHLSMASISGSTELQNMIDEWRDMTGQTGRQNDHIPSEVTTLVERPRPAPLEHEHLFAGFGLRNDQGPPPPAASTSQPWPPSHLAPADTQLLSQPRVRELLEGECWTDKGPMPDLPGDHSEPFRVRLFLSWLAAVHTPPPPSNTFALFPAPVAFMTNKERQAWYYPSGNQAKMFGHVEGFLEYAADAFKDGKKMVLGLFTPVFATPQDAEGIVAAGGESARQVFNNHAKMRRFGTALMLRQVERNGVRGLQVAFFCPWDRHDFIKAAWKAREWRLLQWKQGVVDAVDAWADKVGVTILEGFSGGSIAVRKGRDHDSVEMCAGWLLRAVTRTEKTIPGEDEGDEWEWEEVCLFRKQEHWGPVEKEGGMEIDAEL